MVAGNQSGGDPRGVESNRPARSLTDGLTSWLVTAASNGFHGYCGLCIARCGYVAVVDNGRIVALEPDPTHPTGQALCAKGRAAPELVYHLDRLTHPSQAHSAKGRP